MWHELIRFSCLLKFVLIQIKSNQIMFIATTQKYTKYIHNVNRKWWVTMREVKHSLLVPRHWKSLCKNRRTSNRGRTTRNNSSWKSNWINPVNHCTQIFLEIWVCVVLSGDSAAKFAHFPVRQFVLRCDIYCMLCDCFKTWDRMARTLTW